MSNQPIDNGGYAFPSIVSDPAFLRLRELMQQSTVIARYSENRWATRAQLSKRGTVNLDLALQEQWQEQYG